MGANRDLEQEMLDYPHRIESNIDNFIELPQAEYVNKIDRLEQELIDMDWNSYLWYDIEKPIIKYKQN